ncbi:hypothetical protein U3516DRAFT_55549 [Neocallimastix sp. 'constans']
MSIILLLPFDIAFESFSFKSDSTSGSLGLSIFLILFSLLVLLLSFLLFLLFSSISFDFSWIIEIWSISLFSMLFSFISLSQILSSLSLFLNSNLFILSSLLLLLFCVVLFIFSLFLSFSFLQFSSFLSLSSLINFILFFSNKLSLFFGFCSLLLTYFFTLFQFQTIMDL